MKKHLALGLSLLLLLTACGSVSPEKYFSTAVLNMNSVSDMGSKQLKRLLLSEPLDFTSKDPQNAPHVSYEAYVYQLTVPFLERTLKGVNELPVTDDTREMLEASKALFNFSMRMFTEEYPKIAALKDKGASQEELDAAMEAFDEKYHPEFAVLYDNLFTIGMDYAKKHKLNVSTY